MRIASLLPSTTEIVCRLGLEDQLVGVSHECEVNGLHKKLPVLTDTELKQNGSSSTIDQSVKTLLENSLSIYKVNAEALADAESDLILTQDHCQVCAVAFDDVLDAVHEYCTPQTNVVSVSPTTLNGVLDSFETVGSAIHAKSEASSLVEEIRMRLEIINRTTAGEITPNVVTLEWLNPLMTGGNWIPDLIELAGGKPLLAKAGKHSPYIDMEHLLEADPDIIAVAPCGFTMENTLNEFEILTNHSIWQELKAVQNGRVYILDGNRFFNRPGPGVFESARIFGEIFHPEVFEPTLENNGWIQAPEN